MNRPHPHRFSKDVRYLAPQPGHHLATVSFELERHHFIVWVIEGPENDGLTFRGMATDFNDTTFFK